MYVYQLDPAGYFVGVKQADPNPVRLGAWLIPANCVTAAPPMAEGRRARWVDGMWTLEIITTPPAPTTAPPPANNEWNTIREKAVFFLTFTDKELAEAALAGAALPPAWAEYRQALTAILLQEPGDPAAVIWPQQPPPIERPLPPDSLEDYAAAKRYQVETGGFVLNGARIDTSRESQALIANAFHLSQVTNNSVDYKTAKGFITLSPEEMKGIAIAAGLHVQNCFSAEKGVVSLIASGSITTRDDINAYPWPSNQ